MEGGVQGERMKMLRQSLKTIVVPECGSEGLYPSSQEAEAGRLS